MGGLRILTRSQTSINYELVEGQDRLQTENTLHTMQYLFDFESHFEKQNQQLKDQQKNILKLKFHVEFMILEERL